MHDVRAGAQLEELAREMLAGSGTGRGIVQGARPLACKGDELLERARRQRCGNHQQVDAFGEDGDRSEVAQRIRRIAVERQVDGQGRAVEEQRIAVGRALRHVLVGDVGAGARLVLDDYLLAEELAHARGEQARVDVDAAAGREVDDEADRARRVRLRSCIHRR